MSAPKAENGFVALENCFVGLTARNNGAKSSMIPIEGIAERAHQLFSASIWT
ncbi:MAG: hypothetical protein ACJ8FZ_17850 [Bradyrhizobium sp.]